VEVALQVVVANPEVGEHEVVLELLDEAVALGPGLKGRVDERLLLGSGEGAARGADGLYGQLGVAQALAVKLDAAADEVIAGEARGFGRVAAALREQVVGK
jgi:hypothetical protein